MNGTHLLVLALSATLCMHGANGAQCELIQTLTEHAVIVDGTKGDHLALDGSTENAQECFNLCCDADDCYVAEFHQTKEDGQLNNCFLYDCNPRDRCQYVERNDTVIQFFRKSEAIKHSSSTSHVVTTPNTGNQLNADSSVSTTTNLPFLQTTTLKDITITSKTKTQSVHSTNVIITTPKSIIQATHTTQSKPQILPTSQHSMQPEGDSTSDNDKTTSSVLLSRDRVSPSDGDMTHSTDKQNSLSTAQTVQDTQQNISSPTTSSPFNLLVVNSTLDGTKNSSSGTSPKLPNTVKQTKTTSQTPKQAVNTVTAQASTRGDNITVNTTTQSTSSQTVSQAPAETLVTTSRQPVSEATTTNVSQDSENNTSLYDRSIDSESQSSHVLSMALIGALSFGIIFFLAVMGLVFKRCFDSWQRRHYSRIDYLVNGMYN